MSTASIDAFRADVLVTLGAESDVRHELLRYGTPIAASVDGIDPCPLLPLDNEPHLDAWTEYAAAASREGAFPVLRERFVQLQFPIRAGISQQAEYRSATRQGRFEHAAAFEPGLVLRQPDVLSLSIESTMAGALPVLVVPDRQDFESLVQAFTERNEPAPVPPSMGACIVTGLNNWDRVARYRTAWSQGRSPEDIALGWPAEFSRLATQKPLYQDRFVILSCGPYSGVTASDLGEDEQAWLASSLAIRREHELTHYFTYRLFGVMRNNVVDELLADFVGLLRTYGRYRPEQARRFLGLESFPQYRRGGRLESYLGSPRLSEPAFVVLQRLAAQAIVNLDVVAATQASAVDELGSLGQLVHGLAHLSLEELASDQMVQRLADRLSRIPPRGDS